MPYQVISQPLLSFYGNDGLPLDNGSVYIGASGLNPELYPIKVYWDSDLTQLAAQPIVTSSGFPTRQGIASRIYVSITDGAYSITVRDKKGILVYSRLVSDYVLNDVTVGAVSQQIATNAATASASAASATISANSASSSASLASASAAIAVTSATTSAAYANINWAGFTLVDGELIVTYASGATSIPSLVDGEFIITY